MREAAAHEEGDEGIEEGGDEDACREEQQQQSEAPGEESDDDEAEAVDDDPERGGDGDPLELSLTVLDAAWRPAVVVRRGRRASLPILRHLEN